MSHECCGQSVPEQHKSGAPGKLACFVVTSSDTRTGATDTSGSYIRDALMAAGHSVVGHRVVPDDQAALRTALEDALAAGARTVIVSGGTGLGRRDTTPEVVEALFEKRLDGFGELFRMLSFEQIGSAAMMSRAVAGTWRGMMIFALPGSEKAARLALEKLILPELGHVAKEMAK